MLKGAPPLGGQRGGASRNTFDDEFDAVLEDSFAKTIAVTAKVGNEFDL